MTEKYVELSDQDRARAKAARVPVDSFCPSKYWLVCLDSESRPPTDLELKQIFSYTEFKVRAWYNDTWIAKLLERELIWDGGSNTLVLKKTEEGGWQYRRASWVMGPMFVPAREEKEPLVKVMDRERGSYGLKCDQLDPKWVKWKTEHPDIFPAEAA